MQCTGGHMTKMMSTVRVMPLHGQNIHYIHIKQTEYSIYEFISPPYYVLVSIMQCAGDHMTKIMSKVRIMPLNKINIYHKQTEYSIYEFMSQLTMQCPLGYMTNIMSTV